ncbi:MarR family winged helix-turn-helix transcriptional regulator [Nocardia sp. NBC_01503]|uniref:MarR family winged helix-turn-helix transcriptional regulator n=1 Tax=Nocardia sp. NBC_01503 TaxID=2975997 RepID=UPI002E7C2AEF|nr:MarR family winged helix-turn-helix transcriptional regulator [Nocardia sp. NBC_01503]WTL31532.1 MarR family winged helix-turn-helix transcriptional regulator [Nocardia sp. NBC_01503]
MADHPANPPELATERPGLETEIARDVRALAAVSEQIGHSFARSHELRPNDFRALVHVATAEAEGTPLTAGGLGTLTGVSPAAITYLVERMIDSGHLERAVDATDRRRVKLHYTDQGMAVAAAFFMPLATRMRAALSPLSDSELETTHRTLVRIIAALREFATELDDPGAAPPAPPMPGPKNIG